MLPRPTPITFRPSGRLVALLYSLTRRLALWLPKQREQILGIFAPFASVTLLLYWTFGLALGYGVMLAALGNQIRPPVQLSSALYFSAVSLLTLGFGDVLPLGGLPRVIVIIEAASGLSLFALTITFLFALFGEFQRRKICVVTLSARAGAPPSALTLLEAYADDEMVDRLPQLYSPIGKFGRRQCWKATSLTQYSPSSAPLMTTDTWVSALGAVLDAATLILTTIEEVPRGPARVMSNVGAHLVEDLGQYFRFDGPAESYVEREEFDEACRELRRAGYRIGDPRAPGRPSRKCGGECRGPLNAMARQWLTPPAQWIGDRSVVSHHSGRVVHR